MIIEKLSSIIRVQATQGKREASTHDGAEDRLLPTVADSQTFSPASQNISQSKSVEVIAFHTFATMGHQIQLDETDTRIIPLRSQPNGNIFSQQRSWSGRREAMQVAALSLRSQESISDGWTECQEFISAPLLQVQFPMSLQDSHQFWQIGDKPFTPNTVGCPPTGDEGLLDGKVITAWMFLACLGRPGSPQRMGEQTDGVFAVITSAGHKLIQNGPALTFPRLTGARRDGG